MNHDGFGFAGTTIDGKYRLDAVVGEGGFGIVYRGFHLTFEHPIAIKCLKIPGHFTTEAQRLFFEKFREEGKLLSKLCSVSFSVVRVFDFGVTETAKGTRVPYLVLEWLEGQSLEELLADRRAQGARPYEERAALALLRPAVEALATAHKLGIAHRDVKPANVFIVAPSAHAPGTVKVLDFGIAKAMHEGETATRLETRTSSGFAAFSPQYGAPEQFYAKKFGATGPWTDVHALGLCLVEMVSGRPALEGDETAEFLDASTREERPTPRVHGATVSDEFQALCLKALARMPKERFPNAHAMLEALDALAQRAVAPLLPERPIPDEITSAVVTKPAESKDLAPIFAPTLEGTVLAKPATAFLAAAVARTELAEPTAEPSPPSAPEPEPDSEPARESDESTAEEHAEPEERSEAEEPSKSEDESDAEDFARPAPPPRRAADLASALAGGVRALFTPVGSAFAAASLLLPWVKRLDRNSPAVFVYGPNEHPTFARWDEDYGTATHAALWICTWLAIVLTMNATRKRDPERAPGSRRALAALVVLGALWFGGSLFAAESGHWWGPLTSHMPGVYMFFIGVALLAGSAAASYAEALELAAEWRPRVPWLVTGGVVAASLLFALALAAPEQVSSPRGSRPTASPNARPAISTWSPPPPPLATTPERAFADVSGSAAGSSSPPRSSTSATASGGMLRTSTF